MSLAQIMILCYHNQGDIDMEQYYTRHIMRLPDYDYNTPGAYFMTICTKDKQCILSRIVGTGVLDGPKNILSRYGMVAEKYINQMNEYYDHISIASYVIMPNHIHLLLCVNETNS